MMIQGEKSPSYVVSHMLWPLCSTVCHLVRPVHHPNSVYFGRGGVTMGNTQTVLSEATLENYAVGFGLLSDDQ